AKSFTIDNGNTTSSGFGPGDSVAPNGATVHGTTTININHFLHVSGDYGTDFKVTGFGSGTNSPGFDQWLTADAGSRFTFSWTQSTINNVGNNPHENGTNMTLTFEADIFEGNVIPPDPDDPLRGDVATVTNRIGPKTLSTFFNPDEDGTTGEA